MNFDKSTVRLHYLHIFFIIIKFQGDQILIVMSSIICLNSSFYSLKSYIKDEFIDQTVNYIRLACMLRTYRAWNPTVEFSKYKFNNKSLGGVPFFRITSSVTWTQPYIS